MQIRKAIAVGLFAVGVAGCGTTAPRASSHPSSVLDPTPALSSSRPVGPVVGCSTATASAPTLGTAGTHFIFGPLTPFGVATSSDSKYAFVANASGALYLYALSEAGLVSLRAGTFRNESLLGLAITPDGRYLVSAEGGGATVFDVGRIEHEGSSPPSWILGHFASKGDGAIEAAISPDGHYAFVTLESSAELVVFNLQDALAHGFHASDLVGYVPLGVAPVGMAIAPNGRHLYVTSEGSTPNSDQGTLSTIDLTRAEHRPSRALISVVSAGCSPVRVVANGDSVYVTARGSNALLSFSADSLVSDPAAALRGQVLVGEAPVGVALVNHDRTLVVADSNRFADAGIGANLAIITVAGSGQLSLAGYAESGRFPRDMAVSPDGVLLLVSNFGSSQVEAIDVTSLP